VSVQL
jgi:hypothetical protein